MQIEALIPKTFNLSNPSESLAYATHLAFEGATVVEVKKEQDLNSNTFRVEVEINAKDGADNYVKCHRITYTDLDQFMADYPKAVSFAERFKQVVNGTVRRPGRPKQNPNSGGQSA